jgi:thiol-disulfide isomerase/thioredoxin
MSSSQTCTRTPSISTVRRRKRFFLVASTIVSCLVSGSTDVVNGFATFSMQYDRHNTQHQCSTKSSTVVNTLAPLLTSEILTSSTRRPDVVSLKAAVVVDTGTAGGSSIRSRVKDLILSQRRKFKNRRRPAVVEVDDMDVFTYMLDQDNRDAFTVVMFHAPFCKACQASLPLFEQLASRYNLHKNISSRTDHNSRRPQGVKDDNGSPSQRIKFLSVTVTKANSQFLQDSFGVSQFPLAQIYHSQRGLVDERPVLRKLFPVFEQQVQAFVGSF